MKGNGIENILRKISVGAVREFQDKKSQIDINFHCMLGNSKDEKLSQVRHKVHFLKGKVYG